MKKILVLTLTLIVIVGCPQNDGSTSDAAPSASPSSSSAPAARALMGPGTEPRRLTRKPNPSWKPTPNPDWYGLQPAPKLAAATPSSQFPASWTQATWAFDPAKTLPCTSDSNSCSSLTCAGGNVGPCQHYAVAWQRWGGTYSPRLRQATTITFLSNQTDNTDPVYFTGYIENGAPVKLVGPLGAAQTICTGTLAAVTNFTPPTTLQTATICPAATTNQLIVVNNAAPHTPTYAWTYKSAGGPGVFNFSIPVTDDNTFESTWANGNAYTVYAPVQVNLAKFAPTFVDVNGATFDNVPLVKRITAFDPNGIGFDPITIGDRVAVEQVAFQRYPIDEQGPGDVFYLPEPGIHNSTLEGGILWGNSVPSELTTTNAVFETATLEFGILGGSFSFLSLQRGMRVTGDIVIPAQGNPNEATTVYDANVCSAFLDTGAQLDVLGIASNTSTSCGIQRITGTGALNVVGSGRYVYPAGAGGAASVFIPGGVTMQLNGGSSACIGIPAAAAIGACAQVITPANLDMQLGATQGCLFVPGGASYCNGGL